MDENEKPAFEDKGNTKPAFESRSNEKPKFETIKSEEVSFGNNKFIEVARKKAVTGEGENTFISISRGFVNEQGEKRYMKSFTIPLEDEVIKFVSENLVKV
jgi:hypothetical protein